MLRRSTLAGLVAVCAAPLYASNEDTIVVTATRTARTVDQTLASVTVLTRADIERRQIQSVPELLRGVPGLGISNNGGAGKATSVFLRGTESDHVLVLIDGIKVGSATLGTTAFQDLPIDQIERVEVVRGPRSSLYGSEAIGGVIQIFTRKGGGATRPRLEVGAGSFDTERLSAGIAGGGEHAWYDINITDTDTRGFNACSGRPGGPGCFTFEDDRDGYSNRSGSVRVGARTPAGVELEARVLRSESSNEFDGSSFNRSESVQQVVGTSLKASLTDYWYLSFNAGRSTDESDNFLGQAFSSRFDSTRDTISLQNDFSLSDAHLISVGSDYQNDSVSSTTAFDRTSRDNQGGYLQYQGSFDWLDLQIAGRHDDNEQFGTRYTRNFALGLRGDHGLRYTFAFGTAFKAPTFNELFFPGFGNPALRPENAKSTELGLRQDTSWGHWSITGYHTRVENQIVFDPTVFRPANLDAARIRGLELGLAADWGAWHLAADLTLMDAKNRSSDANQDKRLPRRADQMLRVDLDRDFGQYRLGASLFAEGRRFDDIANTFSLPAYALVDIRGEIKLRKDLTAGLRIGNLLGKRYETARFYNQADRNFFLTLRYQPQIK